MSLVSRVPALAPFGVRSFRFQWPADLAASWAFEMETLILGWYMLVETGSVIVLAVFGSLQFLGTLQYTEANTQHFAEWYRQSLLLGGFFASNTNGTLRLEATAQAVAALVPYLEHAVQ